MRRIIELWPTVPTSSFKGKLRVFRFREDRRVYVRDELRQMRYFQWMEQGGARRECSSRTRARNDLTRRSFFFYDAYQMQILLYCDWYSY